MDKITYIAMYSPNLPENFDNIKYVYVPIKMMYLNKYNVNHTIERVLKLRKNKGVRQAYVKYNDNFNSWINLTTMKIN